MQIAGMYTTISGAEQRPPPGRPVPRLGEHAEPDEGVAEGAPGARPREREHHDEQHGEGHAAPHHAGVGEVERIARDEVVEHRIPGQREPRAHTNTIMTSMLAAITRVTKPARMPSRALRARDQWSPSSKVERARALAEEQAVDDMRGEHIERHPLLAYRRRLRRVRPTVDSRITPPRSMRAHDRFDVDLFDDVLDRDLAHDPRGGRAAR